MKTITKTINKIKSIIFLIGFYLLMFNANATSTLGGDLAYRWINATSIELSYTFYRDCNGVPAQPYVNVYISSNNCYSDTIALPLFSAGTKIDNICASTLTTCQGGSIDGADKNIYKRE